MKALRCLGAIALVGILPADGLHAMISSDAAGIPEQYDQATTVFEGSVVGAESFLTQRGTIETRFSLQVVHPYKGRMPAVVSLVLPGGVVGNQAESVGCQPRLKVGETQLFLLTKRSDGAFEPVAACASAIRLGKPGGTEARNTVQLLSLQDTAEITDQPASGLLLDSTEGTVIAAASSTATNLLTSSGLGARFLQPDRGETIPYLVDADALPPGITLQQALGAVSNAIAAWEAISSVRFSYLGLQSFGQGANTISTSDGIMRIQLHDLYGSIGGGSTLGIGGRGATINSSPPDWTSGGQVFGNDFYKSTRGYVVLAHTKTSMENLATFEEVLCHELGHALSMAHTTPDTPAAVGSPAYEAQMYYLAHQDGRGAAPTSWDENVLNQIHPLFNTPPYVFDRVMDITTDSPQPNVPGINEIAMTSYDLQGSAQSISTTDPSSNNGIWTVSGTNLSYVANGAFPTTPPGDPAGNLFYDRIFFRSSDGVHQSPPSTVRVLRYARDTWPSPSDGIPDDWMTDEFGSTSGAPADGDADEDHLTNLEEYRTGMDPNSAGSAQLISAAEDGTLSWQAKAYELYEVRGSTDLTNWFFVKAVSPTNTTGSVTVDRATYNYRWYRAFKVK